MSRKTPKKTRATIPRGAGRHASASSGAAGPSSPGHGGTSLPAPPPDLSITEEIFVLAFMVNGGNATRAYMEAYPNAGYATARVEGSRTLAKPNVQRALRNRVELAERKAIASADERDTVLTLILRNPTHNVRTRIRAIHELNKATGRHSMTHKHEGKITLEQALSESRTPHKLANG